MEKNPKGQMQVCNGAILWCICELIVDEQFQMTMAAIYCKIYWLCHILCKLGVAHLQMRMAAMYCKIFWSCHNMIYIVPQYSNVIPYQVYGIWYQDTIPLPLHMVPGYHTSTLAYGILIPYPCLGIWY
jgi:hypothetical protein